ncbi:DUF6472 family protein [Tissierella sp. Yu-01]|uniref:DUF6472 family protein n=1 Tax=Tissierella sp. Yu-01 TaxID=3035694 RepID=UPI0032199122
MNFLWDGIATIPVDYYICMMNLDQDEMERFVNYSFDNCPYFKLYDEYKTVKKQN